MVNLILSRYSIIFRRFLARNYIFVSYVTKILVITYKICNDRYVPEIYAPIINLSEIIFFVRKFNV